MPVPSSPSPGESTSPAAAAVRPFDGLVVVELGHSVAAPFAGQILSELGAEVIKVEKPEGDDARRWGPPFWEGAASTFQALNRNKRSVVRDLRSPQELAELVTLIVERADVVLQNLRPGQVEKLGLDGQTLTRLKPGLIYCNLGAFGREGPLKDRPGYDPLMQAFGGIMSTTGEPGRPAVRVGASIVDMGTGMWAVIGILTALHERKGTGKGRVVDISLFETAACWVSLLASHYQASGEPRASRAPARPASFPYKAYETLDGEIVVAAGSDSLFRSLAALVGRPEWAQDERLRGQSRPRRPPGGSVPDADELCRVHPTAHWVERLEAAGIPCSPVQDVAQMLAHPQTQALGLVQPVPDSAMQFIGLPLSFDGQRSAPRSRPPRLGEHTNDLFPKSE